MGRRRHNTFNESARKNLWEYNQYFRRLTELAISMFEWKNLPESVDARFLELTLFKDGQAVFFQDEVLGYLGLQVLINGRLDVYRIPKERRALAVNGYQKQLNEEDSVIIYNNYLHTNTLHDVKIFAERLWNLDRIIDVNCNAQKTPILIQAPETQRLTVMNMYKEYDGNAPVIYGDTNLDINAIKVLKTDAPYVADKVYQLKTQIWNEALTYLGITNLNMQKKERLITDEAIRAMGGVIAIRYSRLESRREAAEKINKIFGLDIEVEYRQDYREADDEVMFEGATGGEKLRDMVNDLRTN